MCNNCEVLQSLHNAWVAMCRQYDNNRDEGIRCAMNILSKVIGEVQSEYALNKKKQDPQQISIDDWLKWFNEQI